MPSDPWLRFLLVCAGGAAGTGLRHALSTALPQAQAATFPVATFAINVLGCLALGVVAEVAGAGSTARAVLGVGVLGGFTTYSTFNLEVLRMIEARAFRVAALYVVATLACGALAGAGGIVAARRLGG